jgi:hypothetical protein
VVESTDLTRSKTAEFICMKEFVCSPEFLTLQLAPRLPNQLVISVAKHGAATEAEDGEMRIGVLLASGLIHKHDEIARTDVEYLYFLEGNGPHGSSAVLNQRRRWGREVRELIGALPC